jgi:hypothetical protein
MRVGNNNLYAVYLRFIIKRELNSGLLAQLVQSAALTEQRSLVRAQYSPQHSSSLPPLLVLFLAMQDEFIYNINNFGKVLPLSAVVGVIRG